MCGMVSPLVVSCVMSLLVCVLLLGVLMYRKKGGVLNVVFYVDLLCGERETLIYLVSIYLFEHKHVYSIPSSVRK